MDNTDFVFVANTKAFRRLLLLYNFKFSILSFCKVEVCKKETYIRMADNFFKKVAYINLVPFYGGTTSYFSITVIDYSNKSYYVFSKKVDIDVLVKYKLVELLEK